MTTPRVLIVDDDEATRVTIADLVRHAGYLAEEASDGPHALERLHTNPEGLIVLLDYLLPGMDGLTLLQMIEADPMLNRRHAFIFLSAATWFPREVVPVLTHLHIPLVRKPFEYDELLAAITQAARRLEHAG